MSTIQKVEDEFVNDRVPQNETFYVKVANGVEGLKTSVTMSYTENTRGCEKMKDGEYCSCPSGSILEYEDQTPKCATYGIIGNRSTNPISCLSGQEAYAYKQNDNVGWYCPIQSLATEKQ